MKCINKNYYNVYIVTIKWDLLENGLVSMKNVNLQLGLNGKIISSTNDTFMNRIYILPYSILGNG